MVSYQTVKLARGQHCSPTEGVCAMELASMLAGEPFSDHPLSVSPVIAALLRRLNDRLADDRRQELYAYATRAVGTAPSSEAVEATRLQRLLDWADEVWARRPEAAQSLLGPRRRQRRRCHQHPSAAAQYALGSLGPLDGTSRRAALALVDELIKLGAGPAPARGRPRRRGR